MKRKALCPVMLFPLILGSCSPATYAGTYSFQMGKKSGAHMTMAIALGNESVKAEDKELGRKMSLFLEMDTSASSSVESGSESSIDIDDANPSPSIEGDTGVMGILTPILAKGITLDGYYNVGEATNSDRKQLELGFQLTFIEEDLGDDIIIDNEVLEHLIFSEITYTSVYLNIPVSLEDLLFQLYWYGYDLSQDLIQFIEAELEGMEPDTTDGSVESVESLSVEEKDSGSQSDDETLPTKIDAHPVNTHPSKEEIDKINETYPGTHSGRKFRDFHTVSLTLSRE